MKFEEQTDSEHPPADIETSTPCKPVLFCPQATTIPENGTETETTSPSRGIRNFGGALTAMFNKFSSWNRAANNFRRPSESTGNHMTTPTHTGTPGQETTRNAVGQKGGPSRSTRNHPIRSAMRGSRPRRPRDPPDAYGLPSAIRYHRAVVILCDLLCVARDRGGRGTPLDVFASTWRCQTGHLRMLKPSVPVKIVVLRTYLASICA